MLKIMLAAMLAAYAFVPTIWASVVLGVDDWGCNSCLRCGPGFIPGWVGYLGVLALVGSLSFMGYCDIKKNAG